MKPTSNECHINGFGDWQRNMAPNTAKVTNMIEAEATCQRNMFSEIKIAIKRNTKVTYSLWWCDAMIKDECREETSKFAALFGRAYNDEICFVSIEPKFIVCHPVRNITKTVT